MSHDPEIRYHELDGEMQPFLNAAGVAVAVMASPLGPAVAMARLRQRMSPEHVDLIQSEVEKLR